MNTIYELIRDWKDLISKIYSENPLAASLITLIGVAAFLVYEYKQYGSWAPPWRDILIALVAWVVAVPILGFLFSLIVKIGTILVGVGSFVWRVVSFVYGVYEIHPLFILVLIALTAAFCLVWHWRRPAGKSFNLLTKAAISVALFVVAVAICAPVVNLVSPKPAPSISDAKAHH